ncbi:MAG: glycosyltransferase [Acidobacteria bacterium]|nr:glycosyltransferase [Acidobacteriota bacterium]
MSDAPVRVVVLNYNGGTDTIRCFDHLTATDWPADQLQLICVDNGSTDGSVEQVRRRFPQVEIRALGTNTGFPANNAALRDLEGVRHVALINNDAFVEPDWLAPLVEALDTDPGLGAVCPKLVLAPRFAEVEFEGPVLVSEGGGGRRLSLQLRGCAVDGVDVWRDLHLGAGGWGREVSSTGSFEWVGPRAVIRIPIPGSSTGPPATAVLHTEAAADCEVLLDGSPFRVRSGASTITFPLPEATVDVINNVGSVVFEDGCGADRGWLRRDAGQFDEPAEVFAWCGGGVLLRPAYLADVGLFDESFFLYYEDTDLSWRGQARGWRYRTVPSSRVRHVHAASSGEGSEVFAFHVERNRLLMLVKNAPARLATTQTLLFLRATASYALRDILRPLLRAQRPRPILVRRRLRSFVGFLRLLPATLRSRRQLRRRALVPDRRLQRWLVER